MLACRGAVLAAATRRPLAAAALHGGFSDALLRRSSVFGRSTPVNLGVVIVPQQRAWLVERFGKFSRVLEPGLHFLIPLVDRIAYTHSLKEEAVPIANQTAITRDNVTISIDGVLYVRVVDPYAASYGVEDALYAVTQLAQTTMRSELGKITLDKTFEERESLNQSIVASINQASEAWGVQCLRYEIRDIAPPRAVKAAMDMQAEAERKKRAEILESEGERQSFINIAEGKKRSLVLEAEGRADGIRAQATATAAGVRVLADAVREHGGSEAVAMRIAEQYIDAFGNIAKQGNTVLLPANVGDPAAMVAQALAVYKSVSPGLSSSGAASSSSSSASSAVATAAGVPAGLMPAAGDSFELAPFPDPESDDEYSDDDSDDESDSEDDDSDDESDSDDEDSDDEDDSEGDREGEREGQERRQ